VFGVGQTVGNYRIESRLSEGGMATLVLGRRADDPTSAPVAIKVIHEHLSEDWQFVRMFIDEALISVRLRHPNVVRTEELGEQNNVYFLVMEYVHGCSLAQLLRAMGKQGRRMRPEIGVWIAQQVAAGLHAAHEMTGDDGALLGVIHRDVSPQNILLAVDGHVKLLDFGIAKAKGRAERTEAGVIKGKVRYMSPEQAAGDDIDHRVDIYALGVVLWEMLTMRRYIDGKSDLELIRKVRAPDRVPPSKKAQGVGPLIDDACMAALSVDPRDRPATAAHLYHLLAKAVPEGVVGPAHVAELLRLFVADEIEAAAHALPAAIGQPIAARVRDGTPLPGEAQREPDDGTRVETLSIKAPPVSFEEEAKPPRPPPEEENTRSMLRPRPAIGELAPPRSEPPPDERGAPQTVHDLPSFDQGADEATMEASNPRVFEAAHEAAAEFKQPVPPTRAAEIPPTAAYEKMSRPARIEEPAPPPAASDDGPSVFGWILRVLLITVLAFAIGAGIAVLYVRYFAP
jgi:serine/threonine protein kinase